MKKIAIVGAGIAGLAAAVRLQAKGYQVTVFEQNPFAGGKLSEFSQAGYRFDAGPSLFTLPQLVEDLFAAAGKPMRPYFDYRRLEVSCRYFWNDGSRFTAWADKLEYAKEMEKIFKIPARRCLDYLALCARKYKATESVFIQQSLHKMGTYFSLELLKCVSAIPYLDIFSTMDKVNRAWFDNPKVVQLFNRYATYNGSDPYQASGILTMIPHLEQNIGTFLPVGGMRAISQSVYQLGQDLGVNYQLGTAVEEIVTDDKAPDGIAGVKVGGQLLRFDKVVCNMDVFFAYDKLLPKLPKPQKILSQEKSSSAMIFYWGISRTFPELDVHNIFFADDYKAEFEAIFKTKTLYADPTVYINITSKQESGDAPQGGENWFVMVNVPALQAHDDWEQNAAKLKTFILKKLSAALGQDIAPLIATEHTLSPATIQSRTFSHLGALYGASSNNRNAAFLRHPNQHGKVKGLYFCGGSVHPGGGIPLCLSSAKIVADMFPNL